jgi:hypothetical protein
MSEDRIPSSFYLQQPQRKKQKKYKKDPDRPKCVNKGCDCEVHLVIYTDSGKPIYRPVCMNCHYANIGYKNYKYKQGVIPIKKDYCENYLDERLGRPCPTQHDKTRINKAEETGVLLSEDLDLDHIDGDHYNNTPENTQTLCKSDHAYKTKMMGDHKTRGSNAFVRDNKKKKEDLRILPPKPIEHPFWEN